MPGILVGLDLTDLTGVAGQKLTVVTLIPFLQPCSPHIMTTGITRAHHHSAWSLGPHVCVIRASPTIPPSWPTHTQIILS